MQSAEHNSRNNGQVGKKGALLRVIVMSFAVTAIIVLCCVPRIAAENAVPTMTIHAIRYEFDPAEITLKKGKTVQLLFVADDVPHGISIPDLNIDVDLPKHKAMIVTVTPQTVGDFDGECSKYCGVGHNDMTFTVHVTP